MDRRFVAILVAVVVVLGGAFYFTRDKDSADETSTTVERSDHVIGAGTSGVELVEFADFQCPACGFFHPILKQVKSKYGDQIKFGFKNFPLTQIHDKANAAHRAAEAASVQGKFWEMHDLLYENQNTWAAQGLSIETTESLFEGYATNLGLDIEKFKADVRSASINDIIKGDVQEGQSKDVVSTPTFFLNGELVDAETQQSIRTAEDFFAIIDKAIADTQGTP